MSTKVQHQDGLPKVMNREWFTPLLPSETNLERIFEKMWQLYASHEGWYSECGRGYRLEGFLGFPGGHSLYAARALARFVQSLARSMKCFVDRELPKLKIIGEGNEISTPLRETNFGILVSAFAEENIRDYSFNHGKRYIEVIFRGEQITGLHYDVVEKGLLFLSSDEGRTLFAAAHEYASLQVRWENPKTEVEGICFWNPGMMTRAE